MQPSASACSGLPTLRSCRPPGPLPPASQARPRWKPPVHNSAPLKGGAVWLRLDFNENTQSPPVRQVVAGDAHNPADHTPSTRNDACGSGAWPPGLPALSLATSACSTASMRHPCSSSCLRTAGNVCSHHQAPPSATQPSPRCRANGDRGDPYLDGFTPLGRSAPPCSSGPARACLPLCNPNNPTAPPVPSLTWSWLLPPGHAVWWMSL